MKGFPLRALLLLFAATWLLAGCQPQRTILKPSLTDQGELFLYVRTLPREARRLKFALSQVSAVKDDGSEYPLSLSFKDFSVNLVNRQRFFASGQLPPGDYVALAVGVAGATLLDEEGEEKLLVPEKPVRIDCRFNVTQKRATFSSLAFNYDKSVMTGYSFNPVFTVTPSGKPVTGLVGYVSNYGSNTLTVFDKQYREVVGVIATGAGPKGLAFDQLRRRAYVALAGDDAVEVIDIPLGEEITRIRLKPGDAPQELALTPDGKLLLAVDTGTNMVSVIDPLSYQETDRIQVGNTPESILLDPAGTRAYVFNSFSQSISVIDVASRSVVATVPSEPGLSRGQFSRNGTILYTIHEMNPFVRLLAPFPSLALQQRYRIGMGAIAIKLDTLTNLVYVGKRFSPDIEVYEPSTFVALSTIRMNGSALHMAIDGEQNNLFVINSERNTVDVINLVTREVIAEFDVGEAPYWTSLMGER
ncbi:MAG: hypothetical protein CXR31_12175 [Geobacter sp.]|nr:MAG: hypothetical protein CXR31_12175 [Geobacter sp.]